VNEESKEGEVETGSTQMDREKTAKSKRKAEAKADLVSPTLCTFFSDSKISASTFFKSIQAQQVKRFAEDDESQVTDLMVKNDSDGERLWALMSQSSLPGAVDRWIWRAAQDRLRAVIGPDFDPVEHDSARILKVLRDSLSARIGKDKEESKTAENWLRIGICWLVGKRSLSPWAVAEDMQSALFQDKRNALQVSTRALQKGRFSEFRVAIAMAVLGQTMIDTARIERDTEKRSANGLRDDLVEARSAVETLRTEMASLNTALDREVEARRTAEAKLEAERQHWGHDLSETKAEQRLLLGDRVAPLLSDAIDALEIEPQAPQVALKRLKSILSIIDGAKK
jgi:hypothetical protein